MITILGSTGFVGSHLASKIKGLGIEVFTPKRNENIADGRNLGHVIYCIGMTADFRKKPYETIEAHVCKLKSILESCVFDSFTYLSSTRVYINNKAINKKITEEDDLVLNPNNSFDLFAASKITGELLALNCGKENIKIARLSNVFGSDFSSENFITSIIKDALIHNKVELRTTPDSAKDYISIDDVCSALIALATIKEKGIYNVASGFNTTNKEILDELNKLTGADIVYTSEAQTIVFQQIDNAKLVSKTGFKYNTTIVKELPEIISNFKVELFAK